ncbi:MAG: hypothetical protein JW776_06845 [Candidatus Lokiarchaeota archaeon]|nr:hypothetical protein [Candidatus Lokiarchaeota archaeon]
MRTKKIQCYGCALLCDDVYIKLTKDGVVENTINSCFRGNGFIKNYLSESRLQQAVQKQSGLEILLSHEEVVSNLKEELLKASSIKFYGLGAISYQDQLQVLNVARKLYEEKKTIQIDKISENNDVLLSPSLTGIGQGINNADVFIFWNVDPTHSHPKLFGKLLFSRGMFRLSGKEMKKFILIQKQESDLTRLKDILIDNSTQSSSQLVTGLIHLLEGKSLDEISIGNLSKDNLRELKTFLQATEYGIIICNTPIQDHISITDLNLLMEKLNTYVKGRFSLLALPSMSNDFGLTSALFMTFGEEIASISPKSQDPADLAIIFGGEYLRDEFNPPQINFPEKKVILFDNFKSSFSSKASVTIPYSIPGIEANGTAIRLDGINLNLHKWNDPPGEVKSISEIFQSLLN